MLDFLGHRDAHDAIVGAIEALLADPQAPRTPTSAAQPARADVGLRWLESIVAW